MGIAVQGCRPRLPNKLKWWLTPRQQEAMRAMLGADDPLMQFADWTILTGLRVEETFRLTRDSFNEDFTEVNVPGLKTVASQATLPLSSAATVVATYVFKGRNRGLMFHTVNYRQLMRKWATLRKQMEIEHPGATLKAFRRGAARQLTVAVCPWTCFANTSATSPSRQPWATCASLGVTIRTRCESSLNERPYRDEHPTTQRYGDGGPNGVDYYARPLPFGWVWHSVASNV